MKPTQINWQGAKPGAEPMSQLTKAGLRSYWLAKVTFKGHDFMLAENGQPVEFDDRDQAIAYAEQSQARAILLGPP